MAKVRDLISDADKMALKDFVAQLPTQRYYDAETTNVIVVRQRKEYNKGKNNKYC